MKLSFVCLIMAVQAQICEVSAGGVLFNCQVNGNSGFAFADFDAGLCCVKCGIAFPDPVNYFAHIDVNNCTAVPVFAELPPSGNTLSDFQDRIYVGAAAAAASLAAEDPVVSGLLDPKFVDFDVDTCDSIFVQRQALELYELFSLFSKQPHQTDIKVGLVCPILRELGFIPSLVETMELAQFSNEGAISHSDLLIFSYHCLFHIMCNILFTIPLGS
jgi:hypothetical protein